MSTYSYRSRNVSMVTHIYDSRLEEMGADWVRGKAKEVARLARLEAPRRTGRLVASIKVDRRMRAGSLTSIIVRAGAGYAAYVHEGTYGPIHAKGAFGLGTRTGKYANKMWVPERKGGWKRVWMYEVDGQPSQPFLSGPMQIVLAGTRSPFRDVRVPVWVPDLS